MKKSSFMPEQKEKQNATYRFTWKKKMFQNEENIQKHLRSDNNGKPVGNEETLQFSVIRPGLHVAAYRTDPKVMPCYDFDVESMPVGFSFHLSGKIETTCEKGLGRKTAAIVNQRGVNSVFCLHGAKGFSRYLSYEIQDSVVVFVDSRMAADLLVEELDGVSKDYRNLLQQKNLFFSLPMTREMYNVAAQAIYHPYQGTAARLHLESCGLELLALQIERLKRDIHRGKPLCRADEERIRTAGDILVQKMDSPPTITELALQVGVSSAKLKRGFKQVFGTAIGQFLLQHRMTCARELLLNREIDVAQAAFSVGYSNVSHFIRYYKKTFGVTPGCHKQARDTRRFPYISDQNN